MDHRLPSLQLRQSATCSRGRRLSVTQPFHSGAAHYWAWHLSKLVERSLGSWWMVSAWRLVPHALPEAWRSHSFLSPHNAFNPISFRDSTQPRHPFPQGIT